MQSDETEELYSGPWLFDGFVERLQRLQRLVDRFRRWWKRKEPWR